MRVAGLICDLRHLKFVHLSERKSVCDANALNFVILRLKNALNSSILAFSKALSAKSVVNSACGIAWQSKATQRKRKAMRENANLATHNTAWRGEFGNETAQQSKIQWHGKASTANSVWRVFAGKTKRGDTANSAREKCGSACALCVGRKFSVRCRVAECGEFGNAQHSKFSLAGACGRSRQSENGAVFGRGTSLSLSLSLVARTCSKPLD